MENSEHIIKSIDDEYNILMKYNDNPVIGNPVIPIQFHDSRYINNIMLLASINAMSHEMNLLQAKINYLLCIMKRNNMN